MYDVGCVGVHEEAGLDIGGGGGALGIEDWLGGTGELDQRCLVVGASSGVSSGEAGRGLIVMVITLPPAVCKPLSSSGSWWELLDRDRPDSLPKWFSSQRFVSHLRVCSSSW